MTVYENLLVKNATDVENAEAGLIPPEKVRQETVRFKVDTGAHRNVISRETCRKLGLRIVGSKTFGLAGGGQQVFDLTSPIQLVWRDRDAYTDAAVAPAASNNLLSITSLELLGLKVDPVHICLEPAFGEAVGELE